jgi:CRP-like cAMP-binding protein
MNIIDSFIYQSNEITPELRKKLESGITYLNVKKGEMIQPVNSPIRNGYFVKKGLLRSYTVDSRGKEHIFMFAPEGWIIGDIEAQTRNTPTLLNIDALEDSELEVLSEKVFFDVKENFPEVLSMNVDKLTKRIGVLQRRVIMLMSATARERYEEFLRIYPNIVQRVPQKMIASYLGITPEALSKIRREIKNTG